MKARTEATALVLVGAVVLAALAAPPRATNGPARRVAYPSPA